MINTVGELIAQLHNYPLHQKIVRLDNDGYENIYEVEEVEITDNFGDKETTLVVVVG